MAGFFCCGFLLNVCATFSQSGSFMRPSLHDLEQQRRDLVSAISALGDLPPGSVTGIIRRCGKPTCHCAHPGDPGHGPNLRLTYKQFIHQGRRGREADPQSALARRQAQSQSD
jgi:hypothetical protein